MDNPGSGYTHFAHNHGRGDFGFCLQSTSHIESIWSQIKTKIKNTYYVIPGKYILHFVKEAKYKLKIRNLPNKEKIKDFFDIVKFLRDVEGEDLGENYFLSDSSDDNGSSDESD